MSCDDLGSEEERRRCRILQNAPIIQARIANGGAKEIAEELAGLAADIEELRVNKHLAPPRRETLRSPGGDLPDCGPTCGQTGAGL